MRLHFQGSPQTERQRQLPYCGKTPKRKNSRIPEFQDTPSTDSFTYSRSHLLASVPSAPVPLQIIHLKPKRDWPAANGSLWTSRMKGTTCQEHPGDSWGATHSWYLLVPKEKPEQTHPKHGPHGTKGPIPQIFDIFSGKMTMWEGRKLGIYSPGRSANMQLLTRGFLPV